MNKGLNFKVVSIVVPALLCIIAILLYTLNIDGEFVYDDDSYFINNNIITTISPFDFSILFGAPTNFWGEVLPFRDFLYVIQYKLFGGRTTGYHIVSLLLYIISYAVLFKLVFTLIKDHLQFKESDKNIVQSSWLLTLFITSFFLFHPIYVESFSYISGQKDALSLLFILLTIYFFHEAGKFKSNVILCFVLGVLFHYLAIFSKFSALSSILFIPILLIATSKYSGKKLNFLMIGWLIANIPVVLWFFYAMTMHVDEITLSYETPMLERIPRAFNYIGYHITHVLKPWPLNFGYPANIDWTFDGYFILGILFMGTFSFFSFIKRNLFVLLGFFIFSLYISTVVHVYPDIANDKVYDRYLAVPFIGIIIALIPSIYFFLSKNSLWKKGTIVFCVSIVAILGFLTSKHLPVFNSMTTALGHTYYYFPNKHNSFAFDSEENVFFIYINKLINEKEFELAEELINRKTSMSQTNGQKNYLVGRIYMEKRDFNKAIELFQVSSKESDLSNSINNADGPLARIYMLLGRYSEAEQVLMKMLAKNKKNTANTAQARAMLQELTQIKDQQINTTK